MNPDEKIIYSKNQYKKFIKDVVSGTLERTEYIEETIVNCVGKDIKLDKLNSEDDKFIFRLFSTINFLKLYYKT